MLLSQESFAVPGVDAKLISCVIESQEWLESRAGRVTDVGPLSAQYLLANSSSQQVSS